MSFRPGQDRISVRKQRGGWLSRSAYSQLADHRRHCAAPDSGHAGLSRLFSWFSSLQGSSLESTRKVGAGDLWIRGLRRVGSSTHLLVLCYVSRRDASLPATFSSNRSGKGRGPARWRVWCVSGRAGCIAGWATPPVQPESACSEMKNAQAPFAKSGRICARAPITRSG